MHAASDVCNFTQENVTLIVELTIVGAQEAESYNGEDDKRVHKEKEQTRRA
jgi:hypothetical protein